MRGHQRVRSISMTEETLEHTAVTKHFKDKVTLTQLSFASSDVCFFATFLR